MLIGLTGLSCSGKNYVGNILKSRGFEVWDLDREAEKIRVKNKDKVLEAFGTTNPREIGKIVFSDPSKRTALENIIYPELIEKIKKYPFDLVINGATIHRSGLDKLCSFVIYVDAPYRERMIRALHRDSLNEDDFEKRNNSQTDIDYRTTQYACPVKVIDNFDKSEADLIVDLDRILTDRC